MELSESALSGKKVSELKELCKEKNLPVSGTKPELLARLLGNAPPPKKQKTLIPKTKTIKISPLDKEVFKKVIQQGDRQPIVIKRNLHGHFEHPETHLIFSVQKKVIGVQVADSPEPQPLTTKDLENVYKYHFELAEGIVIKDQPGADINNESDQQARLEELYAQTTNTESQCE